MQIDTTKNYEAVFRTEKGDFTVELEPEAAPGYVNNFVFLARNRFYEGLTFHRVIPGFVAQGGDPTGTGSGGPGYTVMEETNNRELGVGAIAMARSSAGVSGSQFFITLEPQPALEPQFASFGQVTSGMDVVRALTARDPQQRAQPPGDRILKIDIVEKGG
jgi:cyclophilin family peptidyl-prolyl cis-trans isomerase